MWAGSVGREWGEGERKITFDSFPEHEALCLKVPFSKLLI